MAQSKFAYLVIKHRYYDKLNSEFEALNRETKAEIRNIRVLEDSILDIKQDDSTVDRYLS